jgi:hypothetical protein
VDFWIALASVVTSGVVGISGKTIDAFSKRGDRKHQSALEYEKRAWDTKTAPLTAVIEVCLDIKEQCELRATDDPERFRRIKVVEALARSSERIRADRVTFAVAALSTESVHRHFQTLLATINAEARKHADDLSEMRRLHASNRNAFDRIFEPGVEKEERDELFDSVTTSLERNAEAADRIANNFDVDIEALKRECESLIAEARKDLRP